MKLLISAPAILVSLSGIVSCYQGNMSDSDISQAAPRGGVKVRVTHVYLPSMKSLLGKGQANGADAPPCLVTYKDGDASNSLLVLGQYLTVKGENGKPINDGSGNEIRVPYCPYSPGRDYDFSKVKTIRVRNEKDERNGGFDIQLNQTQGPARDGDQDKRIIGSFDGNAWFSTGEGGMFSQNAPELKALKSATLPTKEKDGSPTKAYILEASSSSDDSYSSSRNENGFLWRSADASNMKDYNAIGSFSICLTERTCAIVPGAVAGEFEIQVRRGEFSGSSCGQYAFQTGLASVAKPKACTSSK
jgi:hypothetical protein